VDRYPVGIPSTSGRCSKQFGRDVCSTATSRCVFQRSTAYSQVL